MTTLIKFYKVFLMLFLISSGICAQSYEKTPIPISDIEKGFKDIDSFRAVLLEKGFKFDKEDSTNTEFWGVLGDEYNEDFYRREGIKSYDRIITIQISTWNSDNRVEKWIVIQIRKESLPKYNEIFHALVTTSYPEKRAEKILVTDGFTKETKEDYQLVYFNKNSDIFVQYEENDYNFVYFFILKQPKN